MAQRVGDGIPERRRDRNLGRVTVGVIQRHRAAAARVIDVDRVRRDEYSLGGERRAGAEREHEWQQERAGHQKNTTVRVTVPV